jgi:hypothetical protein
VERKLLKVTKRRYHPPLCRCSAETSTGRYRWDNVFHLRDELPGVESPVTVVLWFGTPTSSAVAITNYAQRAWSESSFEVKV